MKAAPEINIATINREWRPESGLFVTQHGAPLAVDRRVVAFVQADKRAGGTVIGVKISGQKPVTVTAPFDQVYRWWTTPLPREAVHEG